MHMATTIDIRGPRNVWKRRTVTLGGESDFVQFSPTSDLAVHSVHLQHLFRSYSLVDYCIARTYTSSDPLPAIPQSAVLRTKVVTRVALIVHVCLY